MELGKMIEMSTPEWRRNIQCMIMESLQDRDSIERRRLIGKQPYMPMITNGTALH